jgi:hypothetical protein
MGESIFFLTLLMSLLLPTAGAETQACQPFRVYRNAAVPPVPPATSFHNRPANWEKDLVHQISHSESGGDFEEIYWRTRTPELTQRSRFEWLKCIAYYVGLDADHDGVHDWTSIVDQKISRTLQPADEDLDGDGIENILDPAIYRKGKAGKALIPRHLLAASAKARVWQRKLRRDYGILAVDHTATHSPFVLEEFYELLQKSFSTKFVRSLSGVKILYAFNGHDDHFDIAAYHQRMRAISIGGDAVYLEELGETQKEALLATLAHEMGHAFLLEKIRPADLRTLCEKNGWKDVFRSDGTDSFYAEAFFRRHPGWPTLGEARQHNFFSAYSYSNAHEWFADAFAEVIMASVLKKNFDGSLAFSQWLRPLLK